MVQVYGSHSVQLAQQTCAAGRELDAQLINDLLDLSKIEAGKLLLDRHPFVLHQLVDEVAMLMALEPSVYMFDEPTAGMSVDDVPVILHLIEELRGDASKTILLVEHKMDVIRSLADRIIVLHNGRLVAGGEPAAVIASPVVQEAYLGLEPVDARAAIEHGGLGPRSLHDLEAGIHHHEAV